MAWYTLLFKKMLCAGPLRGKVGACTSFWKQVESDLFFLQGLLPSLLSSHRFWLCVSTSESPSPVFPLTATSYSSQEWCVGECVKFNIYEKVICTPASAFEGFISLQTSAAVERETDLALSCWERSQGFLWGWSSMLFLLAVNWWHESDGAVWDQFISFGSRRQWQYQ